MPNFDDLADDLRTVAYAKKKTLSTKDLHAALDSANGDLETAKAALGLEAPPGVASPADATTDSTIGLYPVPFNTRAQGHDEVLEERTFASLHDKVDAFRDQATAAERVMATWEIHKAISDQDGDVHAALRAHSLPPLPLVQPSSISSTDPWSWSSSPAAASGGITAAAVDITDRSSSHEGAVQKHQPTATVHPGQRRPSARSKPLGLHARELHARGLWGCTLENSGVSVQPRGENSGRAPRATPEFSSEPTPRGKHWGKQCDVTGMDPIIGWRFTRRGEWKGDSYDLCQSAFDRLPDHEKAQYDRIAPPNDDDRVISPTTQSRSWGNDHTTRAGPTPTSLCSLFGSTDSEGGRQPKRVVAALMAVVALGLFLFGCVPEMRRNLTFKPAMCEPYADDFLRPEIRPYRHCTQLCLGCYHSYAFPTCAQKLGMHWSINEYDMDAAWMIAGSCSGGYCCQQTVCQTCHRTETVCSRRRLGGVITSPGEEEDEVVESWVEVSDEEPPAEANATWVEVSHYDGLLLPPNTTHAESVDASGSGINGPSANGAADSRRGLRSSSRFSSSHSSHTRSCHSVRRSYTCNCRCAAPIYNRGCSIHCQAYWRSFLPVRVSVAALGRGFYIDSDGGWDDAARENKAEMLAPNATPPAATVDRSEVASDLEGFENGTPESYSPSVSGSHHGLVTFGWSRVVTLMYEHRASRDAAMANLMQPEHLLGSVTPCYYDPYWSIASAVIPSSQLAFESEMGYTVEVWVAVALLVVGSLALACRYGCCIWELLCCGCACCRSAVFRLELL